MENNSKLIKTYMALPPVLKGIVKIMGVHVHPVSQKRLLEYFHASKICNGKKVPVSQQGFRPLILKLKNQGLIINENGKGLTCPKSILFHAAMDAAVNNQFEKILLLFKEYKGKQLSLKNNTLRSVEHAYRLIQSAVYCQEKYVDFYRAYNSGFCRFINEFLADPPLLKFFNHPFTPHLFDSFSPFELRVKIISTMVIESGNVLESIVDILRYVRPFLSREFLPELKYVIVESYLYHGRINIHGKIIYGSDQVPCWELEAQKGCHEFVCNNNESALTYFRKALTMYKKETGRRKVFISGNAGLFFLCALLKSGTCKDLQSGLDFVNIIMDESGPKIHVWSAMEQIFQDKLGIVVEKIYRPDTLMGSGINISMFFAILFLSWIDIKKARERISQLDDIREKAAAADYLWIEAEACALLARLGSNPDQNRARSCELHGQCSTTTITDIVKQVPMWENRLLRLANLGQQLSRKKKSKSEGKSADTQRLIWILDYDDECKTCNIRPRLQKLTKKKTWSKGRAVALKNLYHNAKTPDWLTDQDQRICRAIDEDSIPTYYRYYRQVKYAFDLKKALPALAGHPYIFLETSLSSPVEFLVSEPELRLRVIKDSITITMDHFPGKSEEEIVIRETPSRFKLISFSDEQKNIAKFIGRNGLKFPGNAEKLAIEAVTNLSSVITVNSDLDVGKDKNNKIVKADPTPNVHVMPWQDGICIEFFVRPFVDAGSYFRPGRGGKTVFAEIGERKVQAVRDLDLEKKLVKKVIEQCPTLDLLEEVNSQWLIGDPEDALELLLEMKNCREKIVMSWPRGGMIQVRPRVSLGSLSLNIKKDRDWFKATGSLKIDDNTAIDLGRLMTLLENSSTRFITMDDGTFLAITTALKERLEELRTYSTSHKKGVRFSPLAAPAIEDLVDDAGSLKSDKSWKAHCKKLKNIVQPQIPGTLQADLRDYQITGFNWLAKLANWNVGACLADDMGLGKTVQALAVILLHAAKGPTLVVAPLSVMANWQEECNRFTPTLNPLVFGGRDRQNFLNNLKPFDVVIASYGLLQVEGEKLSGVEWQTIVLDEAQAIKNMKTKRSRAAMKLKAKFRIITTGTPIENHLTELWTLFNFLNPGLLGSMQSFRNSFILPIEQDHDKKTSLRLRKLIQPFILRRLKSDVLKELPEKTETTLKVEMTGEEALLYEAQRLKAIEDIESADDKPGQKHLRILAQLTRLRQLCCNPALVLPDTDIKSSKLKVFGKVVDELMENNHKALVFSQFVGHLEILKQFLDKKGIKYQYLDGSTSAKQRKKRIDAFQRGAGDIFLISLKAGGFGLNLTAADYVIHMDPWWNPAVEDQASDRAHRIGQARPVTVYRIVVKDSIEEKIVALHKEKRELANSLLAGSDMAGRMSASELLTLLKDHHSYGQIKT